VGRKNKGKPPSRYAQIIEKIFFSHYRLGENKIPFTREEIRKVAKQLGVDLPKNLGDMIYSFRYRTPLPDSIRKEAPPGKEWVIKPAGPSKYCFVAAPFAKIQPTPNLAETKIPDATPGVIAKYALNDEQALLARLRYNRLIDIFTGVTCYSLQNHLRTTVPHLGQIETDELYIGIDKRGSHYVFPVQAKASKDSLSIVQIEQDIAMCADKFPDLICRPIGAQFMEQYLIALFEFEKTDEEIKIVSEKHYRLVPPEEISVEELQSYQRRLAHS
jgi:hypothetical protein